MRQEQMPISLIFGLDIAARQLLRSDLVHVLPGTFLYHSQRGRPFVWSNAHPPLSPWGVCLRSR
jgi:hypothetical protein